MYEYIHISDLAIQLAENQDLSNVILNRSSFAVYEIKTVLDSSLFEIAPEDIGWEAMRKLKLQITHEARLKRGIIDITTQPY
jgi:hypothetical protein